MKKNIQDKLKYSVNKIKQLFILYKIMAFLRIKRNIIIPRWIYDYLVYSIKTYIYTCSVYM